MIKTPKPRKPDGLREAECGSDHYVVKGTIFWPWTKEGVGNGTRETSTESKEMKSDRKSRKRKVRNDTIRANMNAGKNILETEEKLLRLLGHVRRMPGNRLPRNILEWEPDGTRRREDRKRDGWMEQDGG
jgi:hypothetical protein